MKTKLRDFFKGKRVLILGMGREGRASLNLLKQFDCELAVADMKKQELPELNGITQFYGEDYLGHCDDFDVIMQSPGVIIKDYISAESRAKITSQTDLLLRYCDNKIIGITGTKGKSTTSSLIYHFLKTCGKKTMLIGNIGIPPLERIDELENDTVIVCEMSCHQLEYAKSSPNIAVLLNIYPEHLDHYIDFNAYKSAKENIYLYQQENDTLIFNTECISEKLLNSKAQKIAASYSTPCDIYLTDSTLCVLDNEIPFAKINTKLVGKHNIYNIGIALAAAVSAGCDMGKCLDSLSSFNGLEHRLEYVRTVNGVEFINDSICTIPEATIAAVKAFDAVDTIIIGGMERNVSYASLADFLNQGAVKNVILLPDSGYKLENIITNENVHCHKVLDLPEAVSYAQTVAEKRVILCPAAASYGFYKNFEERGTHFKQLVNALNM